MKSHRGDQRHDWLSAKPSKHILLLRKQSSSCSCNSRDSVRDLLAPIIEPIGQLKHGRNRRRKTARDRDKLPRFSPPRNPITVSNKSHIAVGVCLSQVLVTCSDLQRTFSSSHTPLKSAQLAISNTSHDVFNRERAI